MTGTINTGFKGPSVEQALGPGRRVATPGTDLPLLHEDPHPSKTAGDVLSQEPSWLLPVQPGSV